MRIRNMKVKYSKKSKQTNEIIEQDSSIVCNYTTKNNLW